MATFDLLDPQLAPRGIAVHMKTPFLEDLRLDEVSYERTARHSVDIGAAMILVGQRGTESLQLSAAERERSLEIALAVGHPRTPTLATATSAALADIVAAARRYEEMGADALSAWNTGLQELTDEEEEELTEVLQPLLPFFENYPPRMPEGR